MRRLIASLLGGILFINPTSAQDPPPGGKLATRPGREQAKGKTGEPAPDALPPGAVARLGTPLRNDPRSMLGNRGADSVCYSPDGRLVASVDAEVHLWDAATGREVRTLNAQTPAGAPPGFAPGPRDFGQPSAVAFAPDGKTFAVVTQNQVSVWDSATGREMGAWLMMNVARVSAGRFNAAFTADGKALIGIVYNNMGAARGAFAGGPAAAPPAPGLAVVFSDPATGKELRQIPVPTPESGVPVASFDVSADGRTIAVGTTGQSIQLLELATGQVRDELSIGRAARGGRRGVGPGPSNIPTLRFAPNGGVLYIIGEDREIVARDLVTGRERRFGSSQFGSQIQVSADGKWLAVSVNSANINVYETASGKLRHRLGDFARLGLMPNPSFALSPDGATIAIQGGRGVRLVDVATGRERAEAAGHTSPIAGLMFTPDGRTLISTAADQVISWDVARRTIASARTLHEERVRARALSPDGNWWAEASFDGPLRVTQVPTGRVLDLEGAKRVVSLAIAPDGRSLVAAESGSVQPDPEPVPLRRWDLTTGAAQTALEPGAVATVRLVFSPDSRRLVGTDRFGGARVWEWPAGRLLWQVPRQPGGISTSTQAAVSPDGQRIILSGGRGTLRLLNAGNGEPAGELEGNSGLTTAVAFAPDSQTVATGGPDGLVRIWDVEAGLPLHSLAGHVGNVGALAYSPDGTLLASGGTDLAILLWDATRLRRPAPAPPPARPELTAEQVTKYWNDLAAADAKVAYKAVRALAASPSVSVPRLQELLPPVSAPDGNKVAELLADLDHNQYSRRQKASESLAALGPVVRSALRQHRATAPAEVRQRIDDLLRRLDETELTGEMLRQVRAVETLEWAGTAEARAVLEKLGQGATDALVTREARAALGRMK